MSVKWLSVGQIIYGLPKTDARRDWWLNIAKKIENGNYGLAMTLLSSHANDDDYPDQCIAICRYIAYCESIEEETSPLPINPAPEGNGFDHID